MYYGKSLITIETMNIEIENKYKDFSLVSGGLIYSMIIRIQGKLRGNKSLRNRAIIMAALSWIPLALITTIHVLTKGDQGGVSFLADLTMYTRLLFAVPCFILVEKSIDRIFIQYVQTTEKVIHPDFKKQFDKTLNTIDKLSNSWLPEVIILLFIYALVLFNWNNMHVFESGRGYLVDSGTEKLTLAGWYFILFSLPVYQLLVFRWIWRFIIWVYSIIRFSRFEFRLEAMHTDQMAGLGYMNLFPMYFSFLAMVYGSIYASVIAMEILYNGSSLIDYIYNIIFFILAMVFFLYAPLLTYIPLLLRTKARGIYLFGSLNTEHNNDYMEKWIYNKNPKDEILGALDNSSLNDITGSYSAVMNMKVVPFNPRMFLTSFLLLCIPFVPLVFTMYSPGELFRNLIKAGFET